jgi:hypothetical protein
MKSLTITFNSKAAADCARTFLTNQNAPYRNSSVTPTKGLNVTNGLAYESEVTEFPAETHEVTFYTNHWANRAETELQTYFNTPNKSTHHESYLLFR